MPTLLQWLHAQSQQIDICTDLDNTVLDYDHYEKNQFGNLDPEALKVLKAQVKKGRRVIVHTARDKSEWPKMSKHLKKLGVPFHQITNQKPATCAAFLDDRAAEWNPSDPQRAKKAIQRIDNLVKQ